MGEDHVGSERDRSSDSASAIDRRRFLQTGGLIGAGLMLGGAAAGCSVPPSAGPGIGAEYFPDRIPQGHMLDMVGSESPIDHVVILMMENRSFDHWLGWLRDDAGYHDRGRRNYGADFSIDAAPDQIYLDPNGNPVSTFSMAGGTSPVGYRGCGFADPGHSWVSGRAQRDGGFLADGSDNDVLALGYQGADDLPLHSRMVRRFTTFDRYHASLLASTQPNRRYLHGAQSGGYINNYVPIKELGHQWPTIWDRLRAARVPVGSYSADLPSLGFYGARLAPMFGSIDQYFDACQLGSLPAVTFIDPPYLPWWQADDHPLCDPAAGQRFLRDVFRAFVRSPHWENGMFVLTYDEWGGFFDHVAPPVLPDLLQSADDSVNFGQAGFRVPTIVASPYSKPGYVDHRQYDHTSIMRFLEWRFLGAPAEGPGGDGWWLTPRDRNANNIGASLGATHPDPEVFDLDDIPLRAPTNQCSGGSQVIAPGMQVGGPGGDLMEALDQGLFDRIGANTEPSSLVGVWAEGGEVS